MDDDLIQAVTRELTGLDNLLLRNQRGETVTQVMAIAAISDVIDTLSDYLPATFERKSKQVFVYEVR